MLTLAREACAAHFVVFNDVSGPEKATASARKVLAGENVPTAKAQISHRPLHVAGMAAGRTAGRDATASTEIDALWLEVKATAVKAAKNKGTDQ